MYVIILFYALLIIVNVFISIQYVLGQTNLTEHKQRLEINKIQTEIKLLESQINPLQYPWVFLTYGVPIVIAFFAAFVPAYYAWKRERNKIPTIEQEKIINDVTTKWYYHSHLTIYNKIWIRIENSQNQEHEVESAWDYLCVKEFPRIDYDDEIEGFDDEGVKQKIAKYLQHRLNLSDEGVKQKIAKYLQHRLNLSDEGVKQKIAKYLRHRLNVSKKDRLRKDSKKELDSLKDRLDMIVDASSTLYYDEVREKLPRIAQEAVSATLGEKKYTKEQYEKVFEESLKKLKRMMVFYRLREDKKIAETILYAAVYDNLMKETNKSSNNNSK